MRQCSLISTAFLILSVTSSELLADESKRPTDQRPAISRYRGTVITNSDLEKFRNGGNLTSNNAPNRDVALSAREKPKGQQEDVDENWRQRVLEIESKIDTLRTQIASYDEQISSLHSDFVILRRQVSNTFGYNLAGPGYNSIRRYDLELRKRQAETDLHQAFAERDRIMDEARKAGVLPGTLRGQKF